ILAITGRVLNGLATGSDAALVPGIDFFGSVEGEADGAPVGVIGGLTVDRPGDHEYRTLATIAGPALVVGVPVLLKQIVIEILRTTGIVRSHHHMTEHRQISFRSP